MDEDNRSMSAREEYFMIKGLRQGLTIALQLKDESKITEAVTVYSNMMKKYRDNFDLGNLNESTFTEDDLNVSEEQI